MMHCCDRTSPARSSRQSSIRRVWPCLLGCRYKRGGYMVSSHVWGVACCHYKWGTCGSESLALVQLFLSTRRDASRHVFWVWPRLSGRGFFVCGASSFWNCFTVSRCCVCFRLCSSHVCASALLSPCVFGSALALALGTYALALGAINRK